MVDNITECGIMVNNMEKACFIAKKKIAGEKVCGMKAKESVGFQNNLIINFFFNF